MEERMSPLKSIRKYCLQCCCESSNEVKLCPSVKCPLYAYRFGTTGRTKTLTDEQRQEIGDRLRKCKSK